MSSASIDIEFRLRYLWKAKEDICAGVRHLEGEELRQHMHYVAEQVAPLVDFAISKALVPLSFVPQLREHTERLKKAAIIGGAAGVLMGVLLKVVGTLMGTVSRSDKLKASGASVSNAGTILLDFLSCLNNSLQHAGTSGGRGRATLPAATRSLRR